MSNEAAGVLAEASRTLAWNVHADKLKETEASENYVLSPYSLTTAFAMALLGARGTTYDEMLNTLALPSNIKQQGLIDAFQASQKSVEASTGAGNDTAEGNRYTKPLQLLTASKMYVQKDFGISPDYIAKLTKAFTTQLEQVDFKKSPDAVRIQINKFVEQATKDKIQDLLPPGVLDEMVRLVLISAVYMKAEWQNKFEKHSTEENGAFYVAHEKRMRNDVPMMFLKKSFKYAENDVAQFVWLPYRGRKVQMVIAVPKARDGGLQAVQSAVSTVGGLHAMLQSLDVEDEVQVELTLPRFKIETSVKLNDVMQRLGMKTAFSQNADFGDMVKNPKEDKLYISQAFQKVMIKVDETGTEAAAATAVVMTMLCSKLVVEPQRVVEVKADKPFVYWVEHEPTGLVLFSGAVVSPS